MTFDKLVRRIPGCFNQGTQMKTTLVILAAMVISGCATQRFGRVPPVGDAEKRLLTCEQIDLEIAKTDEFINAATKQNAQFTGEDVLGFLGDFGIGNQMEYTAAMKSGTVRLQQLNVLRAEKNCGATIVPTSATKL
jgi:hypothetical protein